MTLTPTTVYFIMQADSIRDCLQTTAIIGVILVIMGLIGCAMAADFGGDDFDDHRKKLPFKTVAAIALFCAAIWALIPSTKTLAAMIVVPAIANSQAVQKDFPELYDLAVNKLKEQLAPVSTLEKK